MWLWIDGKKHEIYKICKSQNQKRWWQMQRKKDGSVYCSLMWEIGALRWVSKVWSFHLLMMLLELIAKQGLYILPILTEWIHCQNCRFTKAILNPKRLEHGAKNPWISFQTTKLLSGNHVEIMDIIGHNFPAGVFKTIVICQSTFSHKKLTKYTGMMLSQGELRSNNCAVV